MNQDIIQLTYEKIMDLTDDEKSIMYLLFRVGKEVRIEAYTTGNRNLFMRNVKKAIKRMRTSGLEWYPSWNQISRAISKFERVGLMKIDEDGLPLWAYKEVNGIFS
ncbi:hypothetical protein OPHB3_2638 [Oceanobacillus picturae]|uniref:Uncharacterized protein n=1 Tax=Oceanobacillus picturae TaxID=171693 RepID=A0A0U9HA63_9BACI|nr:hypothetical protein [Oceanobacillus picturae]GAQ18697.1 hypothetical protein OPHB3_2638 [Oceanobacillus picturae]